MQSEDYTVAVIVTRFWSQVDVGPSDQCWRWLGYTDDDGYGQFFWHGRMRPAHELAVSFTTGEARLPSLETCHSCHNPPCCNPSHLRFATRIENVQDSQRDGRLYRITDEQVREMRERAANGASITAMAGEYGVSAGQVSMICSGKRRKESPGPITQRSPGRPRKART